MPFSTCASCGGSHRCQEMDCARMTMEETAQLVAVCPPGSENIYQYQRRQMPLTVEGNITMVMELPDMEQPTCDHSKGKNKTKHAVIDEFREKCSVLNRDELAAALMVPSKEFFGPSLQDYVPCVGCRRSMEEMFNRLRDKRQVRVLEPLIITPSSELAVTSCTLYDYRMLHNILYTHRTKLDHLLDNLHKNKKNRRCQLHSLDNHKTRQISVWIDVWEVMKKPCREEVTIVTAGGLLQSTESYLQKHRFCTECKSKVMLAYNILFGDVDPCCEKGYNPAVYEGLRLCREERHVHLSTETDFIARLISRAEPDLNGIRRERHAKTIDIAQEEVLTCLGLHLYERLHRIWQKLKAEEQTWQLLLYVGMNKLQKAYEMALESKEGMSKLEMVCEEISEADRAKREKKEQKKLKKKARKKNKSNSPLDAGNTANMAPVTMKEVEVTVVTNGDRPVMDDIICPVCSLTPPSNRCDQKNDINENAVDMECNACSSAFEKSSPNHHHHMPVFRCDGDYSSGVECGEDCGHSSRESSDVACSEGMCNHDEALHTDEVDGCTALDEICADCEAEQGDGEGGSVLSGRGKCNGGQPLPAVPYQITMACEGQNAQVQKICQCANEDQLRRAVGWTNRLQDMLTEPDSCLADGEEMCITQEEISKFRANHKSLSRQRQQLRAKLRQRFNRRFKACEPFCALDHCMGQMTIKVD